MKTTFWAFSIYSYVFQRWSGPTKLVDGPYFRTRRWMLPNDPFLQYCLSTFTMLFQTWKHVAWKLDSEGCDLNHSKSRFFGHFFDYKYIFFHITKIYEILWIFPFYLSSKEPITACIFYVNVNSTPPIWRLAMVAEHCFHMSVSLLRYFIIHHLFIFQSH